MPLFKGQRICYQRYNIHFRIEERYKLLGDLISVLGMEDRLPEDLTSFLGMEDRFLEDITSVLGMENRLLRDLTSV